jgi:hypothetical protein
VIPVTLQALLKTIVSLPGYGAKYFDNFMNIANTVSI